MVLILLFYLIPRIVLADSWLAAGATLHAGEYITSGNGYLVMEKTGDLSVCKDIQCNVRLWSSETSNHPGAYAQLAHFGVLNVFRANSTSLGDRLWQSHTMTAAGCHSTADNCSTIVEMLNNGNCVLKKGKTPATATTTLWASHTMLPPPNAKNVLVIVVDDLRPQMNWAYGAKVMHTPNLDKLAKTSLVFNRAYVQEAICNPSRNSFMTGRRPDTTLVWNFKNSFRLSGGGPGNSWSSMPQHFKQLGYISLGGGKIFHPCCGLQLQDYPKSWSRDLGVDYFWFLNRGMCNDTNDQYCELDCSGDYSLCPLDLPDNQFYDYRLAQHTIQALQKTKKDPQKRPFFMMAGFRRPHNNWRYPKRFWDMYSPTQDIVTARFPNATENVPPIAFNAGGFKFTDCPPSHEACQSEIDKPMEKLYQQEARRGYYGAVSFVDEQIGSVLDELETLGLSNNTIVVLYGDHGWQLGEHAEWHKHTQFELATRVPLIIRAPHKPHSLGKRTNAMIELIDLLPTLSVLSAERTVPPSQTDGKSFATVFDDVSVPWGNASYSEYPRCPKNPQRLWTDHSCDSIDRTKFQVMGYSIRTVDWRYTAWISWNGTTLSAKWKQGPTWGEELYDHRNDTGLDLDMPSESINVAALPQYANIRTQLYNQVRTKFEKTQQQLDMRRKFINIISELE